MELVTPHPLVVLAYVVGALAGPILAFRYYRSNSWRRLLKDLPWAILPQVVLLVAGSYLRGPPAPGKAALTFPPDLWGLANMARVFVDVPLDQAIPALLAAVIWLGGGNLVLRHSLKRQGKTWSDVMRPFAFPIKDFDLGEWLALLAIAALTFYVVSFAMR